jgi:hypothetical protein
MSVLRLAVDTRRWDLAAHAIVLATIRILIDGERLNAGKRNKKSDPKGKI